VRIGRGSKAVTVCVVVVEGSKVRVLIDAALEVLVDRTEVRIVKDGQAPGRCDAANATTRRGPAVFRTGRILCGSIGQRMTPTPLSETDMNATIKKPVKVKPKPEQPRKFYIGAVLAQAGHAITADPCNRLEISGDPDTWKDRAEVWRKKLSELDVPPVGETEPCEMLHVLGEAAADLGVLSMAAFQGVGEDAEMFALPVLGLRKQAEEFMEYDTSPTVALMTRRKLMDAMTPKDRETVAMAGVLEMQDRARQRRQHRPIVEVLNEFMQKTAAERKEVLKTAASKKAE
jgi:hypothetical protein